MFVYMRPIVDWEVVLTGELVVIATNVRFPIHSVYARYNTYEYM